MPMRVLVGTSGYAYAEWAEKFYPKGLGASKRLGYYASQFPTVENNGTFARMPTEEALAKAAAQTPDSFVFSLKAHQTITHRKRLRGCADVVADFAAPAVTLGARLGAVLYQLPPNFKKDAARLGEFLAGLPAGQRAAFEFRHASWMDEETFGQLRAAGAALCVAHGEGVDAPRLRTAPWGYLRLRGDEYDAAAIADWAAWIRGAGFTGDVFVYFKHEETARGPRFAAALIEALGLGKKK